MSKENTSFPIKLWSDEDKPREKLLRKSSSALSNAELIAILIGSGSPRESAVTLSKRILASTGNNLDKLGKLSVKQLMKFNGIGEAKAVSIVAALEVGRRRREEGVATINKIGCSKDAYQLLQPKLGDLPHEEFWIIYLNNSNGVLQCAQLSKGGITGTTVDVRLVIKHALELGAVGLILAHNHPSGSLKPSIQDMEVTKKLKVATATIDIKVLDHLILTSQGYYSFADEQLI